MEILREIYQAYWFIEGNTLRIETDVKQNGEDSADKDQEDKDEKEWSMRLLWERLINQEISFENDIDIDNIKAKLQKGILTLRIKKIEVPEKKVKVEE